MNSCSCSVRLASNGKLKFPCTSVWHFSQTRLFTLSPDEQLGQICGSILFIYVHKCNNSFNKIKQKINFIKNFVSFIAIFAALGKQTPDVYYCLL